jgi:hypothetical protein
MLNELLNIPIVQKRLAEGDLELSELGTEGDWNANTISLLLGIDIVGTSLNNFTLYSILLNNGYISPPVEGDVCEGCSG